MKPAQAALAWIAALAIVAALLALPPDLYDPPRAVAPAPVYVVGSSLMAAAVPVSGGGADSLLGDGRAHRRLAYASVTERDLLRLVDAALATRPALIFVEANVFLFDLAGDARRRRCDGGLNAAMVFIHERHARLADAWPRALGRSAIGYFAGRGRALSQRQLIDPATVRYNYPLVVRPSCETAALAAMAGRARAQHTRLVFVLPPRSPYAAALIGGRAEAQIFAAATKLAAQLGAGLFVPPPPWRNDEFSDVAHLNEAGRRHFLAALRRWWAEGA